MPRPSPTKEQVARIISSAGYLWVGGEFQNYKSRLLVKCPVAEHPATETTFGNFQSRNRGCAACGRNSRGRSRRRTLGQLRAIFEARGYRLISTHYVNTKTQLEFICPRGHTGTCTLSNFQRHGCFSCVDRKHRVRPFTEIQEAVASAGYTLHSVEADYRDTKSYITVSCPGGHPPYQVRAVKFKSRSSQNRCPECAKQDRADACRNSTEDVRVALAAEGYRLISTEYKKNDETLLALCPKEHEYRFIWNNFLKGHRCGRCRRPSKGQEEIYSFVKTLDPEAQTATWEPLRSCELDVYSAAHRLGVEYHGLFWHSTANGKCKVDAHLKKTETAEAAGIRVLHFFADEWENHRPIVESIIAGQMGKTRNKVHARKCTVVELGIDARQKFFDQNHLQGDASARWTLGLRSPEGRIVQALSVRLTGYTGGEPCFEIARLASDLDTVVVGGLSRLVAATLPKVRDFGGQYLYTFADRRYSTGDSYRAAGFEFVAATRPGFWYTNFQQRVHRYTLRKDRNCPPEMTNDQYRASQGWHRIFDCGQLKFRIRCQTDGQTPT